MGRPRDRKSGEGLLPRMEARRWKDSDQVTYRYRPIDGKPVNLGQDKLLAIRKVLDMLGKADDRGTLKWVWEKFTDPERPSARWKRLAESTKNDYRDAWKQLEKTFGAMQIAKITPPMVAHYVHVERADAPKRANTEKALLSNLFGHGITLGVCSIKGTIGVEPHLLESRTEAPAEKVLQAFLDWLDEQTPQRRIVGMAAEYASLAGSRKVEFLDLSWPQVERPTPELRAEILLGKTKGSLGQVRVIRAKQRGKRRDTIVDVIDIGYSLDDLLERLQELREERGIDCHYVFPTRDNNAYTAKGFKTLWHRCVTAAIEEKVIQASSRFTFHDLRAYYVTKHKKDRKGLPDLHADPAVTARIYDRNKEVERDSL